ncbi:MAG: hypothetical protein JXN61_08340, partial [Sedimentisphaerales bacterium]|nr:hypothetical protein [Sedimentisphaerales bacterium]
MNARSSLIVLLSAVLLALATAAQVLAANTATNPMPADGAAVPPMYYDESLYLLLDFTPGLGAVSHTGYFSDAYSDVAARDPAHCLGSPPIPELSPTAFLVGFDYPEIPEFARISLEECKTYYWCVDEFDGQKTWPGNVWAFTVMPKKAWNPNPPDGARGVIPDPNVTLTWERGDVDLIRYEISYRIYYGTDRDAVQAATTPNADITAQRYEISTLAPATDYFWRIDTIQRRVAPPFLFITTTGDVWTFQTSESIIYVDDDATGANDGSSWSNAYKFLQDALADANASPKPIEIHVAQGIYKPDQGTGITPGDRTTAFQLINGVTIKGGYAGFGEYTPDARDYIRYETILSGDLAGNDVEGLELSELRDHPSRLENSYHVFFNWALNLDQNAALEGFTITGGNARDPGAGGGMYNYFHGSPKVSECTFIHNSASNGGGMFNEISDPTIECCVFIGNRADSAGGGMYNVRANPKIKDCSLTANSAKWSGGAISNSYSNPRIERCQIKDNSAELHYGGGIYNGESSPYLENCFFTGNSAESGGGVYNINRSSPTVKLCSFTANSARYNGGGMFNYGWSAKLEACTFSNNSANRGGGGIYNEHYSRAILDGCSFTSNT